jgi:hypothetical protein
MEAAIACDDLAFARLAARSVVDQTSLTMVSVASEPELAK